MGSEFTQKLGICDCFILFFIQDILTALIPENGRNRSVLISSQKMFNIYLAWYIYPIYICHIFIIVTYLQYLFSMVSISYIFMPYMPYVCYISTYKAYRNKIDY